MANTENWETVEESDGVKVDQLLSWEYFSDYVQKYFSNTRDYIFRGQRKENWNLTPTLYRAIIEQWSLDSVVEIRNNHFRRFELAARGRIKSSFLGYDDYEKELWALGQHQGLKTPLLDWTKSPFVAAYFAFLKDHSDKKDCQDKPDNKNRAVFALSKMIVAEMSHWIMNNLKKFELRRAPKLEIFEPESHENQNLVNQNGLFTIGEEFQDIQEWVKSYYSKWNKNIPHPPKRTALFKILIPDKDRIEFLKSLNQMNINHLTLFPNLYGAAKYCNFELEIQEDKNSRT
jgi:hypothetical protein